MLPKLGSHSKLAHLRAEYRAAAQEHQHVCAAYRDSRIGATELRASRDRMKYILARCIVEQECIANSI